MEPRQKMPAGRPAPSHRPRLTIGLFIDVTAGSGGYQPAVWAGVAGAAQERDVNLLCFVGGVLRDLQALEVRENAIYGLANTNNVNGLIICGSSIASHIPPGEFASFCDRYRSQGIPIVTIGEKVPGIADISVDKKGMQDAVAHLIEVHDRRRIAFIRGPESSPEAEQRYRAYQEALAEHGLPFDTSLVRRGDFFPPSGAEAAWSLVDAQEVKPDAIVAANDNMAFGALEALQKEGVRVPDDVALIGYDDVEEARAVMPPLTTVHQPMSALGKRAVEMLLELIQRKAAPHQEILPTELVKRQSCGCAEPRVVQANAGRVVGRGRTIKEVFTAERGRILSEMIWAMEVPPTAALQEEVERLLDTLTDKSEVGSLDTFLSTLNEILRQAVDKGTNVAAWQGAISVLRRETLACLDNSQALEQVEDIWQQARVTIAEMAQTVLAHRKLQAEQQAAALREVSEKLLTVVEVEGLMVVLAQKLPQLGIPGCSVALYEGGPVNVSSGREKLPELSKLMLRYDQEGPPEYETSGQVFQTSQLIPGGMADRKRRCVAVVEPLCSREGQLGFALFEMGPREGVIYEALRGQISSALEGALLVQEVQKGRDYLQSLFQASSQIFSLREPQMVLKDIYDQICAVMGVIGADIILIDEKGWFQRLAKGELGGSVDTADLESHRGISLEVMSSNKPRLIGNLLQHELQQTMRIPDVDIGAAACFPFRRRGKSVGVLWVYYSESHRFTEAEVSAWHLFVNQAAIAYDNAMHMSALEHLRLATEKLAGVAEVQEVLQRIVEGAREVLQADSVIIWLYDPVLQAFLPDKFITDGIEPEQIGDYRQDKPRPGGTTEHLLKRGYLTVTNVDDPRYEYLQPAHGLRGRIGAKAFQGIALRAEDDTLGVLYVNYAQPRGFDDDDASMLETFAYHAALTLRKARTLDRVTKSHETTRVIARASVQENLQDTLDIIVGGIRAVLNCDAVTLYVCNQSESADRLIHPPTMTGVLYPALASLFGRVLEDSIVYIMLQRDTPYVVESTADDQLFKDRRFVVDEQIKSCVAIPLKAGERKVGVMFVNYRAPHHFTDEELADVELFADQAAAAIRAAQLYDDTSRRAHILEALYESGRAILRSPTRDHILNTLLESVLKITGAVGEPALYVNIQLYDAEHETIEFTHARPDGDIDQLEQKFGSHISLKTDKDKIGIAGLAVNTRRTQYAEDVRKDEWHRYYIAYHPETMCKLAIPLIAGEQVIGVLSAERAAVNGFDEQDRQALDTLVHQAVIAIQKTEQQERVTKRTLLAARFLGRELDLHGLDRDVGVIRNDVATLKNILKAAFLQKRQARVEEILQRIEDAAARIREVTRSPEDLGKRALVTEMSSVFINQLIRDCKARLWSEGRYKPVRCDLQFGLPNSATVQINLDMLRDVIEILVDNAVRAMSKSDEKRLVITTRGVPPGKPEWGEIVVTDTGGGMSGEIREALGRRPIEKPGTNDGMGIGVLMADCIIDTYQGKLWVEDTGLDGTTIIIRLPLNA